MPRRPQVIDTHSHLFTEEFSEDLPEVMARARAAGVSHIYMPNIDSSSVADLLRVCEEYSGYCSPMIGLHPTSVSGGFRAELREMKELLGEPNHPFVAIGEVGLDLYWDTTFRQEQEEALREQIGWALEYDLPLVIHCRSALPELLRVLAEFPKRRLRGIFHSFTGTLEEAKLLLAYRGFMLGINGVLTFRKSDLPYVLASIPLERIVLETDSPYLAPIPHRGKRNESGFIRHTLERLAEVYSLPVEEVAKVTSENARKVFNRG